MELDAKRGVKERKRRKVLPAGKTLRRKTLYLDSIDEAELLVQGPDVQVQGCLLYTSDAADDM
eukprot:9973106-Prorocentrum_lima.AAC.1